MSDEPMLRFAVLFFAGLGLMMTGGLNLVLRQSGLARRALLAASVLLGVVSITASFAGAIRSLETGLILVAVVTPVLALGSGRGQRVARRLLEGLSRPALGWALCMAVGLAGILAAVVRYESEDRAALDVSMAELELLVECAGGVGPAPEIATTDGGERVMLFASLHPRTPEEFQPIEGEFFRRNQLANHIIHRQPCDDRSNCHGWVFTGGRYRIDARDVEMILSQNGYAMMSVPKPGDLAIYRQNGVIAHSAIVRYVAPDMPTLVEGKWGATGVYLHPVDKCPYGQATSFYRSQRSGHLLTGLDNSTDTPVHPEPMGLSSGTE